MSVSKAVNNLPAMSPTDGQNYLSKIVPAFSSPPAKKRTAFGTWCGARKEERALISLIACIIYKKATFSHVHLSAHFGIRTIWKP